MGKKSNWIFLKLRRLHLWSGLFLVPWVLVYGVSAFIFNHPSWFSSRSRTSWSEPAEAWPEASSAARSVTAAISSRDGVSLDPVGEASWSGALLRGKVAEQEARLIVDPARGGPEFELREAPRERGPKIGPSLTLPELQEELRRREGQLTEVAAANGHQVTKLRFARGPTLRFEAEDPDGARYTVRYDAGRRRLAVSPASGDMSWHTFIRRLHLAHGYPSTPQVRLAWAIFVDVMAGAMLFWCLSGLLMWFQMSKLRKGGLICLGVSLACAIPLFVAMYLSFT